MADAGAGGLLGVLMFVKQWKSLQEFEGLKGVRVRKHETSKRSIGGRPTIMTFAIHDTLCSEAPRAQAYCEFLETCWTSPETERCVRQMPSSASTRPSSPGSLDERPLSTHLTHVGSEDAIRSPR